MNVNNLIEVLNQVGIHTYMNNNIIYFEDPVTKEKYKSFYCKENGGMDVKYLHPGIYLTLENKNAKIKQIKLYFKSNDSLDTLLVNGFEIEEENYRYEIRLSDNNTLSFERENLHMPEMEKLTFYLNDSIIALGLNRYEKYSINNPSSNVDYDYLKMIIESNKYFKVFLEFYSKLIPDFMQMYNSLEMDELYMIGS